MVEPLRRTLPNRGRLSSRPVRKTPLDQINHRLSARVDIIVLGARTGNGLTNAVGGDDVQEAVGPEAKERAAGIAGRHIALMLKLHRVATVVMVEHGDAELVGGAL